MKKLLTYNNSKLKPDGIAVWSLPAGKTCPKAGACAVFCYAKKGFYRMSGPENLRARNHKATLKDNFVDLMSAEIQASKNHTVRIHDSGDFYSLKYLNKWLDIARRNPSVLFYAYTKSVSLVKSVSLPKNMKVTFSYGGLEDHLITAKDRQAKIYTDFETMNIKGYANASHSDLVTAYGYNNKIGLIAH